MRFCRENKIMTVSDDKLFSLKKPRFSVFFDIKFGEGLLLYMRSYGGLLGGGNNSKQMFLRSLQTYVERAITDFVEVNFLSDSN